ncbi:AI-2E family transporter [Intrasporangium sp.]|uniref:AI-2E family transporter n=1 Tax=Intrasporangium sp. TaxID=1925024 RepID=UPI00293AD072|nr:AI-2E family transporter [Intrasporangium sp.]MDV3223309.1 AI-2E family transporter [Intrasporangium sp.]
MTDNAIQPRSTDPSRDPARDSRRDSAVPPAVRAASEWSLRLLVIGVAVYVGSLLLREFSQIVVPLLVAVLLAAMLEPISRRLARVMPIGAAAGTTVVGVILLVSALFTLIGQQFSSGLSEVTAQVAAGLEQIRDWLRTTFNITDSEFDGYFESFRDSVSSSGNLGQTAANVGLTATHFVAGIFIALFALFFFLYDGPRIWSWVVRLFPRVARPRVDSSGQIAWDQLSAFVRATIVVALVDAVGIAVGAAILKVPFAFAIGVLVFLFAFIPIVGALLSGAVAVLLALVAQGFGVALIMLAVVIGVQQLESHVLQPLLLGKAVSVHPLAVILAIAAGSQIAGIVGALAAVPFAAVLNAVGRHLLMKESEAELEDELEESADEGSAPANA